MNEDNNRVLNDALQLWGDATQIDILIEEMSELTKALLKARRNNNSHGISLDVLYELVDVDICLAQLTLIITSNCSSEIMDIYKSEYNSKIERLQNRIIKQKELLSIVQNNKMDSC